MEKDIKKIQESLETIEKTIASILENMITKDDLTKIVTKDDLIALKLELKADIQNIRLV